MDKKSQSLSSIFNKHLKDCRIGKYYYLYREGDYIFSDDSPVLIKNTFGKRFVLLFRTERDSERIKKILSENYKIKSGETFAVSSKGKVFLLNQDLQSFIGWILKKGGALDDRRIYIS